MAKNMIAFDVEKARQSEARIRAKLETLDKIFKSFQDAVDDSGTWWEGKTHDEMMRRANAFIARKAEIENVINTLADRLALAIREKLEEEEETSRFIALRATELAAIGSKTAGLGLTSRARDASEGHVLIRTSVSAAAMPAAEPESERRQYAGDRPITGSGNSPLEQILKNRERTDALALAELQNSDGSYNWDLIGKWLQTEPDKLSDSEKAALATIYLSIEPEHLERFITCGYKVVTVRKSNYSISNYLPTNTFRVMTRLVEGTVTPIAMATVWSDTPQLKYASDLQTAEQYVKRMKILQIVLADGSCISCDNSAQNTAASRGRQVQTAPPEEPYVVKLEFDRSGNPETVRIATKMMTRTNLFQMGNPAIPLEVIKYESASSNELINLSAVYLSAKELEVYHDQLDKRIAAISVKHNVQDVATINTDEKDLLISYYEARHPENAGVIDRFLMPILDCSSHEEDIRNIKYIIYTADEKYSSLLFKNIKKIKVSDHHAELSPDKDGRVSQYYNPVFVNAITVSLQPDRGVNDPRGPYNTFFHEIGHGIDDVTEPFGSKSSTYNDPVFNMSIFGIISREAEASITATVTAKGAGNRPEDKAAALNAIFYGGDVSTLNSAQLAIYNNTVEKYLTDLNTLPGQTAYEYGKFCVVTDMFSAFVTHPAADPIKNPDKRWSLFGGYIHEEDYWHGSLVNISRAVGKEFFAGYFSACITGDTAQLDNMRYYFPDACEAANRMIGLM